MRHRRRTYGVVVTMAGYTLVSVLLDPVYLSLPGGVELSVHPASALPIPFGLVFGSVAAYAVAGGVVASELFTGSLGVESAFLATAMFYLSFSSHRLWGAVGRAIEPWTGRIPGTATPIRYLATVSVAVPGAGVIVAWGAEVSATSPFYLPALLETADLLLANLVLGPVVLLFGALGGVRVTGDDEAPRPGSGASLRLTVASTVVWLLLGTVGSLGYRSIEKVPDAFLSGPRRYVALVEQPLFGPGAARVQVVFGAVMFGLLVVSLFDRNGMPTGRES